MKKRTFISLILLLLVIASCHQTLKKDMMVTRDCTGTYLQINGKDYLVCNDDKLEGYAEGEYVTAKYKEVNDCQSGVVCYMLHLHEGVIEIIGVK